MEVETLVMHFFCQGIGQKFPPPVIMGVCKRLGTSRNKRIYLVIDGRIKISSVYFHNTLVFTVGLISKTKKTRELRPVDSIAVQCRIFILFNSQTLVHVW